MWRRDSKCRMGMPTAIVSWARLNMRFVLLNPSLSLPYCYAGKRPKAYHRREAARIAECVASDHASAAVRPVPRTLLSVAPLLGTLARIERGRDMPRHPSWRDQHGVEADVLNARVGMIGEPGFGGRDDAA